MPGVFQPTLSTMLVVDPDFNYVWDLDFQAIISEAKRLGLSKVLLLDDPPQRMQTPEGPKFLGTDAVYWNKIREAGLRVYYIHKHAMFEFIGPGTRAPFED